MLRLRELRKSAKFSQQELAEKLGITQATLSGWENEKYEIDNTSLLKCAGIFNVSVDYLLGIDAENKEIKAVKQRIKELCDAENPSIEKIEQYFNVNYATFRSWCDGYGNYFDDKISLLADFFNVSIDYLMTGKETKKSGSELTPKNERDIAKTLEKALQQLELQQEALMFDGEPLDDETKELLKISLENTARMAKTLAKKKYTPKKYRKE